MVDQVSFHVLMLRMRMIDQSGRYVISSVVNMIMNS